ncbi:MAG: type II toxin-antitoxin system VapC family toxin [Candidatus Kariarchaeaceae archaeon]|jgi:predicted nucleic acid-binding protein
MDDEMAHLMIDTSFLVALSNEKDKFHSEALLMFKEIENDNSIRLSISDYVIDEFINITMKLYGIEEAISWGKILFEENFASIIFTNENILASAWKTFQKEIGERKPMNITDCVIAVCGSMLKCDEILTYDERLKNY